MCGVERGLWQSAQLARRGWRPFSQGYCQMLLILTPPGISSPGPSFVSSGPAAQLSALSVALFFAFLRDSAVGPPSARASPRHPAATPGTGQGH
ncbi:hypothetical protein H8957_009046, partial [Semnopithecus entellus]